MFLDLSNYQPKGEPWQPERKPKRLSRKQEKILLYVILFNLALGLLAPIGGSTIMQGAFFLFQ